MNIFFIRLALRSIFRKKGFTAINLLGLSLGLAASLYIVTFLFQEYSYDKSYTNPENIYRGILEYQFGENTKKSAFCPAQAGPDIFGAVPEINNFIKMSSIYKEINGIYLKRIPQSARKVIAMGQKRNSSAIVLPQAVKALMEVETGDSVEYWHIPGTRLMVIEQADN